MCTSKALILLHRGPVQRLPRRDRPSGAPDAEVLIADRGYDRDWFREALSEFRACIPGRSNRKAPIPMPPLPQRNRIERMFGSSRTGAGSPRYDRCAHTFMSAFCIAATFIFWL